MAKRIKSGLKHLRKSGRRRIANAAVKAKIKTLLRTATADGTTRPLAQKAIDKAAARGVIHRNTAARRKSRMMRAAVASA
jgi:small subunit ribosomal protein S20